MSKNFYAGALIAFLLVACLSAPGTALVNWDNNDFRLTFEPGDEVDVVQDYFIEEAILNTGEVVDIPISYVRFNTGNMSIFGQVSVKLYDEEQSVAYLNSDSRLTVQKIYGEENITEEKFYEKNGQSILAVSHRFNAFGDSTTANVPYGRCVVIVSAEANAFPEIMDSLTFELKREL
ncbi:MAG TPA: hypothetical protein PLA19_02620 [Candidatus Pacearchaeota archaeon]|nr:hypothetical protein [Candidatus Pacearchaeota archaeon]